MKRDLKYIIKRVIIGILIGLFFIMFKSCNAYAWSNWGNGNVKMYLQTGQCTIDNNNDMECLQGPSFKYSSVYSSSTNDVSVDVPWLSPTQYGVLINNLIYEYEPDNAITTSNSVKSIGIGISNNGYVSTGGTGSSGLNFNMSMFPVNVIDFNNNDQVTGGLAFIMNYNFKPYFCSYYNGSTWNYCNLKLEIGSGSNIFFYVLYDLPVSTRVEKIRLYFGTPNLYSGSTKTISEYNIRVPNNINLDYFNANGSGWSKFQVNYNTWRQRSNDNNIGLVYYPQNYLLSNPKVHLPVGPFTLNYDSNTYSSNTYGFNFSSLSSETLQQYIELPDRIEEELQEEINNDLTYLDDAFDGFSSNSQTTAFVNLASALFTVPINKMREQNNIDLVNYNVWNDSYQLDDKLCWGTDMVGDPGQPYKVQFFRDYKFTLPCPHYDIYSKLKYGDYAFYPTTLHNASIVNGGINNFLSIWLTIQHGLLVYLLFVQVLNIYKYIIDPTKKDMEVLEL